MMTSDRLNEIADRYFPGCRFSGIAGLLDIDDRRVRRMMTGEKPIPDEAAAWLERLVRYLDANPPPKVAFGSVPRHAKV
jgi:hypothetical protein